MTLYQEAASWWPPQTLDVAPTPEPLHAAPSHPKLQFLRPDGKPTIVTFLRHCGCPFAEKTFLALRATASSHPSIHFIAISHSSPAATANWLSSLPPSPSPSSSPPNLEIIVDDSRELYAAWGLGLSSFWHVLSPGGLWSVYRLGKEEGIWNRPTESGSRWQTAGSWAVDGEGRVVWGRVAGRADEIAEFGEGVRALEEGGGR